MFRCDQCGNISQPGEGCNKVVVATRPKVYFMKEKEDSIEVGRGHETVREIKLCLGCFRASEKGKTT